MSDYHVLDGEEEARTYRVVFHITVPNETNRAGVNLRVALAADVGVVKASIVPHIQAAEQTQLNDGEVFEYVASYTRKTGNSLGQDRDVLDARFTSLVTTIQQRLRDDYLFWGFDRDVP